LLIYTDNPTRVPFGKRAGDRPCGQQPERKNLNHARGT